MKDMFDELMKNLDKCVNKDDLLSDSSHNNKDQIEHILQNYESQINTHAKVEHNMQMMIQDYQAKVNNLQKELTENLTRIEKLEKEMKDMGDHNKELESANQQIKFLLNTTKTMSTRKAKGGKTAGRLTTSADKNKTDVLIDSMYSEFRTLNTGGKKPKPKNGLPTSKDLASDAHMTMTEGGIVTLIDHRDADWRTPR
jgi:chromosome segregation ATPase